MLFIVILFLLSILGHNKPKEIIDKFNKNRDKSQSGRGKDKIT
jgi:hypothetical protein